MILDRMLLSLQVRVLLATLAILLVLGLVIDFFESARYLFSVEGTAGDVFMFYLYKIPFLTHLLLPISLVIGSCICFALLGRSLQLRALAAAGIGPFRLAAPTMVLAAIVAGVTIFLAEFLVPPALDRTEKLMEERFGVMDQTWRFYRKHNWFQGSGDRIFRVSSASMNGGVLKGVTLLEMDSHFHVSSRQDFNKVVWQNDRWEADFSTTRRFRGGEVLSFETTRNPVLSWTERPGRFRNLRGRPKQKSLAELATTIAELEHRGLSATRYRLEYHNRFAYPLLALGMVLLALPWLCAPRRKRTLAGALIEATGLIFGAYFLVMMATAAVTGGACSAALGVWLPVAAVMAMALFGWTVLVKRGRPGKP